jgi:hypothetical protein
MDKNFLQFGRGKLIKVKMFLSVIFFFMFYFRALENYILLYRLEYDKNRSINRNELNPQKKDPQTKSVAPVNNYAEVLTSR